MPAPSRTLEEDPRGLFGPIYTYNDWKLAYDLEQQKVLEEKESRTANILGSTGEKPAHWPSDVTPDTGKWAFWLPEGWGQAIKPTDTGKTLKCFIGPPGSDPNTGLGRRIFHKKEGEKIAGYPLKSKEDLPAEAKEVKVRNCHEALPLWPGHSARGRNHDEPDWLPHDWCVCYRQLPTGPHRIYIPPGQRQGYLWHRACTEQWLGGHKKNLTSIASSRKMGEIMEQGREGKSDKPKSSLKRKHSDTTEARRVATEESYAKCLRLAACKVGALDDAGCPSDAKASLLKQEEAVRELLSNRGFTDIDFMACFLTALENENDDGSARPYGKVVERIPGLFYNMTEFNGRPCYHQIRMVEGTSTCTGLYLYWSPFRKGWKLSSKIDDNAAGYAVFPCEEADQSMKFVSGEGRSWNVLTQNFFDQASQPAQHDEQAAQPAAKG